MTIKAIQTRYAGCHFRSRLEARWAVFFDHLGMAWQYEPEGMELPSGAHYLPDFHLPEISAWVEVKAKLTPIDVKWREFHEVTNNHKWMDFAIVPDAYDGRHFNAPSVERTFMVGSPLRADFEQRWTGDSDVHELGVALGPGSPHSGWGFIECPYCWGETGSERFDIAHVAFPSVLSCGHGVDPSDDGAAFIACRIGDAYAAARSARFEHGQSGAS